MTKNISQFSLFALSFLFLLSLSACIFGEKDLCKDLECGVNGRCEVGECMCDNGYSGTNCEIAFNSAYSGNFNVVESCSGTRNYSCNITADPNDPWVLYFDNLYNENISLRGLILSYNPPRLEIPIQTFGNGNFSGTGDISNGAFTLQVQIVDGLGGTKYCGMTLTPN